MYFLIEFEHTSECGESINGGPWSHWVETHTANRLVCAATFLDACIVIDSEYNNVSNFKDLTMSAQSAAEAEISDN